MEDHLGQPLPNQVRKLGSFVSKLGEQEIHMFLLVLGALMAQVPAPRDARKSYLREVELRLRNNGADFLSKSRVFPTFGLKLLGNDLEGFPISGFKQKKGQLYPELFAWYWGELQRLSRISKPSASDVRLVQKILTVLSFSKMIRMSSVNQIKKALETFEKRVTPPSPDNLTTNNSASYEEQAKANTLEKFKSRPDNPYKLFFRDGPSLSETLGVTVELEDLPGYLDLSSISTKPCALKEEPSFPLWFRNQFYGAIRRAYDGVDFGPTSGFKKPPYGKVHVLNEVGGKIRLIVPYNTPFVHSTGLYCRCRSFLRQLKYDFSENQAAGHRMVMESLKQAKGTYVSADMSNFSDDTHPEGIFFVLRYLGLVDLWNYLFQLPVTLPNGRVITPCKLLMGLKGCFELSTLLHHYVVMRGGIREYAMCGDDFFFQGELETYLSCLKYSGWNLNRNKTVVSTSVAVFCGEMYWHGERVSARVPKVSNVFNNGKPCTASVIFSVVRDSIESLNKVYNRRSVSRVIGPFLHLLRKRWRHAVFPELASKLRGLGLKPSRPGVGILKLLSKKSALKCSLLSIGNIREEKSINRWFGLPIELMPGETQPEFPFLPALLKRGAVKLVVPVSRKAARKNISALNLSDALEWFYDSKRVPAKPATT